MLKDNLIHLANNFLKNRTFRIIAPIHRGGPEMDYDYKFKVEGYTKKISVGEWKDYIVVSVDIIKSNNYLATLMLDVLKKYPFENRVDMMYKHFYYLIHTLQDDIINNLLPFDVNLERVNIKSVDINVDENKPINESDMSRIAIRTVVKDITKVLKSKKEGEFYLPEDITSDNHIYSFENSPLKFQIELDIKHMDKLNGYMIDADFYSEDDVIDITIKYNPNTLKKELYNIIGELNEIIAHELEHARQSITEGFKNSNRLISDSFKYYSQPQEILAQKAGFKRLSKLRKIPIEKVVREWFETHKDIHSLTNKKQELIIKKILGE